MMIGGRRCDCLSEAYVSRVLARILFVVERRGDRVR